MVEFPGKAKIADYGLTNDFTNTWEKQRLPIMGLPTTSPELVMEHCQICSLILALPTVCHRTMTNSAMLGHRCWYH
jgi:hypothetical protein